MESLLGFKDETITVVNDDQLDSSLSSLSESYKLVPWLGWDEWESVRDSLFSDSPSEIHFALNRISTWRSRGTLPVVIDVTSSIIEIQQKDPFYRKDLPEDAIHSEQMLAMLYCMAILRLVNCVVEKTRKKTAISIAEAAGAIGIPRTLIDVRHEGSHRDLPALALVRDSAVKAIRWLKSYYWDPQTKQIPFQSDGTAKVRKEIISKLRELTSCLRNKQSPQPDSSPTKAKSSKKHSTKTLRLLLRLYSSFSSEVVSVLLEFLRKALNSSNLMDLSKDCEVDKDVCTSLDDWKMVITKLSNKEPEVLLMLLKAVLNMIETNEMMKYEIGKQLKTWEYGTENDQIEQLSSLFAWLVGQLRRLKPFRGNEVAAETKISSIGMNFSNAIVTEILRKSLLVASCSNKQLMDSAVHLAQLIGGSCLMEKLKKLNSLGVSVTEEKSSFPNLNDILVHQDESIRQATKKLDLVKFRLTGGKVLDPTEGDGPTSGHWVVAKSWNPCPIGMLPRDLGSSGCLPVLACDVDHPKSMHLSEREQNCNLKHCSDFGKTGYDVHSLKSPIGEKKSCKREASCKTSLLDGSSLKKMRETIESFETYADILLPKDVKGCLMVDGVWKQIREEELLTIKSRVKILF